MFFFGHLGIGSKIVTPWSTGLSKRMILLGTILPDLIDKSLYYGMHFLTGKSGADLGLISGTRTFGHTALLLLLFVLTAWLARSRVLVALALGIASHLLLDGVTDRLIPPVLSAMSGDHTASPLFWPLTGPAFPSYPFGDAGEHLSRGLHPLIFWTEVFGAGILAWDFWKEKRRPEILALLNDKRRRAFLKIKERKLRRQRAFQNKS